MEDHLLLPHKLTLDQREHLHLTGVTEIIRFDDTTVVLKTQLGNLIVQGRDLVLKSLSLDGGQAAVHGHIGAVLYEEPRAAGFWQRLFG